MNEELCSTLYGCRLAVGSDKFIEGYPEEVGKHQGAEHTRYRSVLISENRLIGQTTFRLHFSQ